MPEEKSKEWLSVYIYFVGNIYGSECDELVAKIIAPFVTDSMKRKQVEKYFFVRYFERGSHVRLRMFGDRDILRDTVRPAFERYIARSDRGVPFAEPLDSDSEQVEHGPLRWIPYEPETERYGGDKGLTVAEDFFSFSSETVVELLKKRGTGDGSGRLAKGLVSMLILVHVFIGNLRDAAVFLDRYSRAYLAGIGDNEDARIYCSRLFDEGFSSQLHVLMSWVETILQALAEGVEFEEPWGLFSKKTCAMKSALEALYKNSMIVIGDRPASSFQEIIAMLLPSYIHMMNNRLGIPILNESYLASLLNKSFSQINWVDA